MTTEIGDSLEKYKKKMEEEGDDLYFGTEELYEIVNGRVVVKQIPYKVNPRIVFGHDDSGPGGDGSGDDDGDDDGGDNNGPGNGKSKPKRGFNKADIVDIEKNWGIKFTKPGRKEKINLEYMIARQGYQENQDATLDAMLERQIMSGEFKKRGLKIDIKEEDIRYDRADAKITLENSAHFIIMRDVSGSMVETANLSKIISLYVAIGLSEMYKDRVTRVYIAHTDYASEYSEEEFFLNVMPGGGTSFSPAYSIINSMLEGTSYETTLNYPRKIDYNTDDVYVLHITDGEAFDRPQSLEEISKMIPKITRLMYLQIGGMDKSFGDDLESRFGDKIRTSYISPQNTMSNVKKAVTELMGGTNSDGS